MTSICFQTCQQGNDNQNQAVPLLHGAAWEGSVHVQYHHIIVWSTHSREVSPGRRHLALRRSVPGNWHQFLCTLNFKICFVWCRYVLKLRQELEEFTADIFAGAAEREQIRSVLADLAKTSGDFRQLAGWALASLATALMNRLR